MSLTMNLGPAPLSCQEQSALRGLQNWNPSGWEDILYQNDELNWTSKLQSKSTRRLACASRAETLVCLAATQNSGVFNLVGPRR